MSSRHRPQRRPFFFKQFTIMHDRCAMPLNTDSILLGAWVLVDSDHSILDVGSGCGIISLMIAQRNTQCFIDALEIDPESYKQGRENILRSQWSSRIQTFNVSLQNFAHSFHRKYNHIICNPPFFQHDLKSPSTQRTLAKHASTLTFGELLEKSTILLTDNGKLSVIIPFSEKNNFIRSSIKHGLFCNRHTRVRSTTHLPYIRSLLSFVREPHPIVEDELTLYQDDNKNLTKEFADLTCAFYLNIPALSQNQTE